MAAVYSTLFIAVAAVGADASYVVPDGFIAVVRDIAVLVEGAPEDTVATVWDPATGASVWYALQTDLSQYFHWQGRQIFPAGATINAKSVGPNFTTLRVSGYLLTV